MNFLDVGKEIIKRGAPILGAAFGAPGAAVGAIVANVFGADWNNPDDILEKIKSDPEADQKLLEIQNSHELQLAQLALQKQIVENQDRQRATNREIELARVGKNDNTPRNLAYLVTIGFFIFIFLFPYMQKEISTAETQIMMILVGILASKFSSGYDYFLGTSHGSDKKDIALIEKATNG